MIHPPPETYASDAVVLPPSELRVHGALAAALPAGWFAWHSLKVRARKGVFSEADFVIADPARGILVLEVKGGLVRKKRGVWLQNAHPMPKPPLDQAHRFVRILLAKFRDRGLQPPPVGVAVSFPDTEFEGQPTQGDLEGIVIGARELPYLDEVLPALFDRAVPGPGRREPSPGWLDFLHSLWNESWPAAMNLSAVVKGREAGRVRLDAEQFKAVEGALENDFVLVRGGAGTGKTLLVRELARREVDRGRRVLVLTFTEALGLELAAHLAGDGGGGAKGDGAPVAGGTVTVAPVWKFALERLRRTGFDEAERCEPEFWDRVTRLAAVTDGIWKDGDGAFDTVIVDEGQDLGKNEWAIAMRAAAKGRGRKRRMWIFADERQGFWEKRKVPAAVERRALKYNLGRAYRCPPGIQALADAYAGRRAADGDGDGDEQARFEAIASEIADRTIRIVVCGDKDIDLHRAVGRELKALKTKDGFGDGDIAVLSLRGMMYPGNIMRQGSLGGYPLAQATDPERRDRIVCDTFLRYKGLERPVVVVADVDPAVRRYQVRMNIAASRAFGALRVVVSRSALARDPLLKRVKWGT